MEISDIFRLNQKQPECRQGNILIAQPFLQEMYFNHSCICLVDYNPHTSTTGLVLNKKTNLNLNDIVNGIFIDEKIPAFCGGPMNMDRLFFLHKYPDIKGSKPVVDDLFFNGDFDMLLKRINSGYPINGYVKFFIGYSGWDINQLADEIAHHVWAVSVETTDSFLKTDTDDYWDDCVKHLGPDYKSWLLCPTNPSLN